MTSVPALSVPELLRPRPTYLPSGISRGNTRFSYPIGVYDEKGMQ